MIDDALRHSLEQSLATTTFDPEDIELANLFLGSELRPTVVPGAPAMITAELDPDDLSYVFGPGVNTCGSFGCRPTTRKCQYLRVTQARRVGRTYGSSARSG